MDIITLLCVAVALAMDAFSVAVSYGIIFKCIKLRDVFKIAGYFGVFQFGMLFLGNILGLSFSKFVSSVDHWIAFCLLSVIGIKMVYDAVKDEDDEEKEHKNPMSHETLTILAIATSIDALAVGISFAQISDAVLFEATVVGIFAFVISFAGVFIGNKCGNLFGNKSEIFGGVVLVGIGLKILIEHLFF